MRASQETLVRPARGGGAKKPGPPGAAARWLSPRRSEPLPAAEPPAAARPAPTSRRPASAAPAATAAAVRPPLAPRGAGQQRGRKEHESVEKQLASSVAAVERAGVACTSLEHAIADAEALRARSEAHLRTAARGAAPVRVQLERAMHVSSEVSIDLEDVLALARRAEGAQREVQSRLSATLADERAEIAEMRALLAELRDAATECRKRLRDGERVQAESRAALSAASIAVSQAIAVERQREGARGAAGGRRNNFPLSD